MLTPDDFFFHSKEPTEDITLYASGGYHPIILGDIINGQYRVIQKLGFRRSATVWFAQKTDGSEAFVTVKVTTAESNTANEVSILRAVSSPHISTHVDHFTTSGPNGTHSVLVTDVVVPILPILASSRSSQWRKLAAYGLAQAILDLHTKGVVHADLRLGNVGLAFPQLADEDPLDVMQDLVTYDLTIVLPKCAVNQTSSLPAYVVTPCKLAEYYSRIAGKTRPQTKIFDLDSAHKVGTSSRPFRCALEICTPECIFARVIDNVDSPPVEPPADVWALGAAIYEIITGSSLFHGVDMKDLLHYMVAMAESLPSRWRNWYDTLPKSDQPEISSGAAHKWWAERREMARVNCGDDNDANGLINLLRKVFVLDPEERITAEQVVGNPWFADVNTLELPP
ncbi:hypothetical protein M422DRAFT_51099 [Sphaerobolus stellatus SS14]|uniref:non-specific serine/threonine protein kinase n=1 Tax=Sphaerobolus stellatus (strain SS14) TaxID=990650 RepID=A0A0C9U0R1_SPHS4|nr:hypothetical protein M422DRAFT_51099 [Sphaerobolus stellatus SS14]